MAIEETTLPNGQWEVKATGEDLPRLKGMLKETAGEAYKKAFHRNEGIGFEKVSDPNGNETWLRKDEVEDALTRGYGKMGTAIRMQMPNVPWGQKKVGPGRHRFRYDKATKTMVEVR